MRFGNDGHHGWNRAENCEDCPEERGIMARSTTRRIMKVRQRWTFLVALGLITLGVCIAAAADGGPDYFAVTGVAAGDSLNIREKPSTESKKVGEIPHHGRRIQNLGCIGCPSFAEWQKMTPAELKRARQHYWCKVRYRGIEGWVAGRFLKEDSAPYPPLE